MSKLLHNWAKAFFHTVQTYVKPVSKYFCVQYEIFFRRVSAGVVVLADHRLGGGLARPLVHLLHLLRPLRLYRGLPLLLLQITGLQPPSASTFRPPHHHSNFQHIYIVRQRVFNQNTRQRISILSIKNSRRILTLS